MNARRQHRTRRCICHTFNHGRAHGVEAVAVDCNQDRRLEAGLPDVDQHALDESITDLRSASGHCLGQNECRVDAGHLGKHRDRLRSPLSAAIQRHAALFGTGERHGLDQRMVNQRLSDGIATAPHHGEHTFRQTAVLHGFANGLCLNLRSAGMGVVRFDDHRRAGRQCRGGIATGHRVTDGEVARAENGHRAEGDFLQAVIHARSWLAIGLGWIDGQLQEAAFAHHFGKLTELGRGLRRFALKLRLGQAGFQRGPCCQGQGDCIEVIGDALEERRPFSQRGMAVMVERFVGEVRRHVHFHHVTEGEVRLNELIGRGIERFHGPGTGGDFVGAD
ncbi:hypothetical protein D3C84_604970 [compost metagenome]